MGMAISLHIADPLPPDRLDRLATETFGWLREVDQRFSTYLPDSEVNRLHRGELALPRCSADLRLVLEHCARLWRDTDGYFDCYATDRLDPSGYVKGWAVQRASALLIAAGSANHVLNAGGDVRTRGGPRPHEGWRVGVRHPWRTMALADVIVGDDLAVATSGTYERGPHVINPRLGEPARELRAVTVVATGADADLGIADAYATTALAMGLAGVSWLSQLDGYHWLVITEDDRWFRSTGWPGEIADDDAAPAAEWRRTAPQPVRRPSWTGPAAPHRPS